MRILLSIVAFLALIVAAAPPHVDAALREPVARRVFVGGRFVAVHHNVALADFRAVTFVDGFGFRRVRFDATNAALLARFGLVGDVHFVGVRAGFVPVVGDVVTVVDSRGRRLTLLVR